MAYIGNVSGFDDVDTEQIKDDAVTADKLANSINTEIAASTSKLSGIETAATADQTNAEIKTAVEAATSIALGGSPTTTTQSQADNSTKLATTAYTDVAIAALADSAPGTLNTLNELAAALGDDASFSTTVTNSIATKLPLAGGTMTGDTLHSDNVKAKFGTGNDLQIYHDGTHSYISEAGTGPLRITSNGTGVLINKGTSESMGRFLTDGAVELFYDNALKIATTATGVDISGTVTADGGSANNSDAAAVFKGTGTEHIKLLLDTSSTGGHQASIALESNGNEVSIGTTGSGELKLNDAMTIDNNGNSGLGVVPETWTAAYTGVQIGGRAFWAAHSGSDSYLGVNAYHNSGWKYIDSAAASYIQQSGGSIDFRVASSGTADAAISWTTGMTIANSGNVGIGAAPAATVSLDVTAASASSNNVFIRARNTATNEDAGFIIDGNVSGAQKEYKIGVNTAVASADLTHSGPAGYRWLTGGAERMRINSSGNVGIGVVNPATKLDVAGAISDSGGNVRSGRKNWIINGGFDVWQRSTSAALPNGGFVADRWKGNNYVNGTITLSRRTDATGQTFKTYGRLAQSSAGSQGARQGIMHYIEGNRLVGKTITVSFKARANAALTGCIVRGIFTNQTFNLTTGWVKHSFTGTGLAEGANTRLMFDFGLENTTWHVDLAEIQVEVGSVATDFEHRSYGEELALCQRYCYVFQNGSSGAHLGIGAQYNSTAINIALHLPTSMRASPTSERVLDGGSNWLQVYVGSSSQSSNSTPQVSDFNGNTIRLYCPSSITGRTAGEASWCHVKPNAKLILSAEL